MVHHILHVFIYLKEYNEIAAKNREEKDFESSDEFLSNLKKTDRLHPVISLCVYYGEKEWDGPFCLTDLLEIPEKLKPLVSDYRMNLLQLRASGSLQFHNPDVETVFEISRSIYEQDFEKINTVYKEKAISAELGVVIGAITESQKLINHALRSEQKGGQMYMCDALEKLVNEGVQEGLRKGLQKGQQEGILANIRTCRNFHASKEDTIKNIIKEFSISEDQATEYVEKYW